MIRFRRTARLALLLLLSCVASTASAQSPNMVSSRAFLNVNAGAQPNRRTISASQSFALYGETAKIDASQRIANGPLFEIGGGYRLRPALSIGASFSTFASKGAGTMTASIPSPFFYDRPASVTQNAADLQRTERSVHIRAAWTVPVGERIDVSLSAGPSIIRVSQQLAGGSVASGTQTLTLSANEETGNAFGFNAGFDGAYMFSPRFGVGLFVQYAGGSVDLASAKGVKAGGLQTGLGLRARF
jgi:outer membrane protein with beta-barrel domain